MFNKSLLACMNTKPNEFVCRLKITVGDGGLNLLGTHLTGYKKSSYGACEVLEGNIIVDAVIGFSGGGSNFSTTLDVNKVRLVNETTGTEATSLNKVNSSDGFFTYMCNGASSLFSGIEIGQECIVAVYK